MVELTFPQHPSYRLLLKGMERLEPDLVGRGALCPHDWLPASLDMTWLTHIEGSTLESFAAVVIC